jgi:hypothetical protein
VPLSNITQWATKQDGYIMIINSDCRLYATSQMLQDFIDTGNGFIFFHRYNEDENGNLTLQTNGIDAFIFPSDCGSLIPESDILCLGKPHWDFLLPVLMIRAGKHFISTLFPVLLHKIHKINWSEILSRSVNVPITNSFTDIDTRTKYISHNINWPILSNIRST